MSYTLRFHPGFVDPIENGKKRLTIRLNRPEGIRKGDGLKLVDASTNQIFANAIATDIYGIAVQEILLTDWRYHRNYDTLDEFNYFFSNFYDKEFERADIFDVIEWGEMVHPNSLYEKN